MKILDHNTEFIYSENINNHQIGKAQVQYEINVRKVVAFPESPNFLETDEISLVNFAFAYCFKEARLATTGGSDTEINKYPGQVSPIMRILTDKDGNLMSYFQKIKEDDLNDTLLKQTL